MNTKELFFNCLKTEFAPKLRSLGFTGSGQHFRRIRNEIIHTVNVQVNKYGGSCCVNLGLHLTFLPVAGGTQLADPKKLKATGCEFRWRLTPPDFTDYWWGYEENELAHLPFRMEGGKGHGPVEKAQHLIEIYETYGEPQFQAVMTIEAVADLFKPEDIETVGKRLSPLYGYTATRGALTMTRIHIYLGNVELARQFAEVGLRNIGKAKALRPEFEKVLNAT
jgi:hypothetical protein